jgi:hypothetical protein
MLTLHELWEIAGPQRRAFILKYFNREKFDADPESPDVVMAIRYYVSAGYKLMEMKIDPRLPSSHDLWNLAFFLSFHRPFYRRRGLTETDYPPVCAFLPPPFVCCVGGPIPS